MCSHPPGLHAEIDVCYALLQDVREYPPGFQSFNLLLTRKVLFMAVRSSERSAPVGMCWGFLLCTVFSDALFSSTPHYS